MDETVLCIENNTEILDLVELILQRAGFEVVRAITGEDGLALARRHRPGLILLEPALPRMDGWPVHARLQASSETRNIPIIVLTTNGQPNAKQRWLHKPGVADYIVKPFIPRELTCRVQRVCKGVKFDLQTSLQVKLRP